MYFLTKFKRFRLPLRYALFSITLSLLSSSCQNSAEKATPAPVSDLGATSAVWSIMSPLVRAQVDAFADMFLAYAKLQAQAKDKSKQEVDELFRKQMSASPDANPEMVEAVINATNAILATRGGARMAAASAPTEEIGASYDMLPSGAQATFSELAGVMGELETTSETVNPDDIRMLSRIRSRFSEVASTLTWLG